MVSRPAEDYHDENGLGRAGSRERQEGICEAIPEGMNAMVLFSDFSCCASAQILLIDPKGKH